ncbi:glycerol-3-phosphate dehydrogenase subunit GlpB [Vibrio sp. TH_r3]|uniref:glycerol-3-phosphate dehydrogenase subunit GlpB n=1 Tax=Vibrio sp. TH_r3 TaxID=3082084 RepID=UPI0029547471|nr:glycerol-3-phosphate dehydrogenase subunit GlpB [Vibrio sp. TH_r3]MDV7103330.1 glycerol-3-phosphate dehydrogenase subunit GlpB [Vibrio sp. TH_r3]
MLNYDVIIIGGGVAGYAAGMQCLEYGLKTAIISSGQSALHFSSGSIDLLSHSPITNQPIRFPIKEIAKLEQQLPNHPYAKLGVGKVINALDWFQAKMEDEGLPLSKLDSLQNHYRITTMGTLKPTWLSQPFVRKIDYNFDNLKSIKRIVMLSVQGFRDFQPQIAQDNLKRYAEFSAIPIETINVTLTAFGQLNRNPHDFRSIDISRILRNDHQFKEFADQLMSAANTDDLVVLPSIMGNGDGLTLLNKLKDYTKLNFHEVPTMPPSLLGIRIEDTMMRTFIKNGGGLHKGDEVLNGNFEENNGTLALSSVNTKKMGEFPLSAEHFIFATGSFFSKGLVAQQQQIVEPIFDLDMCDIGERPNWHQSEFFSHNPHEFLSFGVQTDEQFLPYIQGKKVRNLFCAGAVLSDYNPISHGCGSGVAISTAFNAVENIITDRTRTMQLKEATV